jgi:hypothetical protein
VKHRTQFVDDLVENKRRYYRVVDKTKETEQETKLEWKFPMREEAIDDRGDRTRRILLCNDETCHKSGEMSAKRWMFENDHPFYNKGRGRSIMVSDFIVQHPG